MMTTRNDRARPHPISSLGRRTALLSISLIFSLGLAELIIRFVAPQQLVYLRLMAIYRPDATYGRRMSANLDTVVNEGLLHPVPRNFSPRP